MVESSNADADAEAENTEVIVIEEESSEMRYDEQPLPVENYSLCSVTVEETPVVVEEPEPAEPVSARGEPRARKSASELHICGSFQAAPCACAARRRGARARPSSRRRRP